MPALVDELNTLEREALARLSETPDEKGLEEWRVEVLGRQRKDALLVPRAALDFAGNKTRVLIAGGGSSEVRLGPCGAQECVVESGVKEGTRLRTRDGRTG